MSRSGERLGSGGSRGRAGAEAGAPSHLPGSWEYETDVAIAGAGHAGVTAAIRACEHDVRLILIEASRQTGGTALFSGGGVQIRGMSTWEELRRELPTLDPVLGEFFADAWPEASKWVQNLGAPVS